MNNPNQPKARALRGRIKTFLQRFGLNQNHQTPCGQPLSVPHAHALMRLLEAKRDDDGGLRISELGVELKIDKSNVSRLCARMEEEGHVERRPCPEDGRAKRLWLTDEGREVAEQVDEASLERFSKLLGALEEEGSPEELLDSLTMLNDALKHLNSED
jgi:DNA-binding MarR family transcriptional regulator